MKSGFISEGVEMGEKESSDREMVIREIMSGFFRAGCLGPESRFPQGTATRN
jgi:hypothetical protein